MLIMATTPVFSIVFGVVLLRERLGPRLALAAVVTVAGVLLATVDGAALSVLAARARAAASAAGYFALPNSLRRTAAILSHWMPSVGLSSLGQASTQLVIVWQR